MSHLLRGEIVTTEPTRMPIGTYSDLAIFGPKTTLYRVYGTWYIVHKRQKYKKILERKKLGH